MEEEKIYIRINYLKAIHYLFFSLGIFSLAFAITFWQASISNFLVFLITSVFYISVSLWIAYFFYKDYEEQIKSLQALETYWRPYIVLSAIVIGVVSAMFFLAPSISILVYYVLYINYYYIFIIIIGGLFYAIKPVRTLFEFQRTRALENGKSIAMENSRLTQIGEYKIGTSPFIDEILEDIWTNKKYPVPHVQRLEIEICNNNISKIEAKIEIAKQENNDPRIIKMLELRKKRYVNMLEDLYKYED